MQIRHSLPMTTPTAPRVQRTRPTAMFGSASPEAILREVRNGILENGITTVAQLRQAVVPLQAASDGAALVKQAFKTYVVKIIDRLKDGHTLPHDELVALEEMVKPHHINFSALRAVPLYGKPSAAAIRQTQIFRTQHRLKEPLVTGFQDGGRFRRANNDGKTVVHSLRETTIVDLDNPLVKQAIQDAVKLVSNISNPIHKADKLRDFVDQLLTPPELHGFPIREKDDGIIAIINRLPNERILLSDIIAMQAGVCRHRALLYKILADNCGLPTEMNRGLIRGGPHLWNTVDISATKKRLVDPMWRHSIDLDDTKRLAHYDYETLAGDPYYPDASVPAPAPSPPKPVPAPPPIVPPRHLCRILRLSPQRLRSPPNPPQPHGYAPKALLSPVW